MQLNILKKYFVFLFLILMPLMVHAQPSASISGRILDAHTHRPIEFVNVALLGPDSTFLSGVVSDSLGNFSLLPGNYKSGEKYILKITHLCYIKQTMTTGLADNICVNLLPNGYTLSQVNVRAIRTKVRNRQNLEYLVTDAMRKKCDLTSEILERIPSVFVDVNSNVYVKGSSNVLILKDGVKISHQSLLDLIPSGSVQKVIVSYHIPSRYANENYTAVINLITKRIDGITLQFKPKVSFDKSWYDSKLNMNLEKGKSSFLLYYQFNYRNFAEHETNAAIGPFMGDYNWDNEKVIINWGDNSTDILTFSSFVHYKKSGEPYFDRSYNLNNSGSSTTFDREGAITLVK